MADHMDDQVDATFYVQLAPEYRYSGSAILGATAVRMTKLKPASPQGGTVTVKLTVRLPRSAFTPLEPAVVVTIPEHLTRPTPAVGVEVGNPES